MKLLESISVDHLTKPKLRRTVVLAGFALLFAGSSLHAGDWRPVTQSELSLSKSKLDPNADVEGLFREVRVLNDAATFGYPTNIVSEYVRIKIFTDRGKDKYGTIQVPYWGKANIFNVDGRTIKPDGTVVEMSKDAVFRKSVVRGNGVKVNVVSFALPAVAPGVIIEYRWSKNLGEFISRYLPLDVQTEFPVDEVTFHIKPVSSQYVAWPNMRTFAFGCNMERSPVQRDGFTTLVVHDVPPLHEEPYMPPEFSAKKWMLVYYEENSHSGSDKYWTDLGRSLYSEYSAKIKVNGDARALASKVTAGAASDDEKINRLAQYCRDLKNVHGDISTEARSHAKDNRTTADTLKQGQGSEEDINLAFAALAMAAGYDARVAKISDRGTFLFNPAYQSGFFLNTTDIAVNAGGKWRFFDINNRNLPLGQLNWNEEGVPALITDPKNPVFVTTPLLNAETSRLQRMATVKLSAEGSLEGEIHEYYLGNRATEWRELFGLKNDEERIELLRDRLRRQFAQVDVSSVKFLLPADLTKGLSVVYHIKIDGYSQRTAKRLFLQPNLFMAGMNPRFTATTRQQPIYFEFPWTDVYVIDIALPEGYKVDHGDAPGKFAFKPVGEYAVKIAVSPNNHILYNRSLSFGGDQVPLFEAKQYDALKHIFDVIHESDNHLLTLKAEGNDSSPTAAAGSPKP